MASLIGHQSPHLGDASATLGAATVERVDVARARDAPADGLADLAVGDRIADADKHAVDNPANPDSVGTLLMLRMTVNSLMSAIAREVVTRTGRHRIADRRRGA